MASNLFHTSYKIQVRYGCATTVNLKQQEHHSYRWRTSAVKEAG
jgi:hypothetical protein